MTLALQEQDRFFFFFLMLETIESNYDAHDDQSLASYDQSNNNDHEYFGARGGLEFLWGQYSDDEDDDDDYNEEEHFSHDDDIDLDDFSYEELIALGKVVGVEKRGLSKEEISSCLVPFKIRSIECENGVDLCVICQVEYENDKGLVALPNCEHPYHSDCISKWLQMKKNCPICSSEISSLV
ncbi:hypothetical protein GQ457_07G017660 [Hibiscus cannabinus]